MFVLFVCLILSYFVSTKILSDLGNPSNRRIHSQDTRYLQHPLDRPGKRAARTVYSFGPGPAVVQASVAVIFPLQIPTCYQLAPSKWAANGGSATHKDLMWRSVYIYVGVGLVQKVFWSRLVCRSRSVSVLCLVLCVFSCRTVSARALYCFPFLSLLHPGSEGSIRQEYPFSLCKRKSY